MRVKSDVRSVRRSLILRESTMRRLRFLREHTEADSDSEIVRKALMYYEQLCDDSTSGRELIVRGSDSETAIPKTEDFDEPTSEEGASIKRTLVLHEKSAARLDALCVINAVSASELVRDSLIVYEKLVDNTLLGRKLIVRDHRNNDETQYFIPVSRPIPPKRRPSTLLHTIGFT